MTGGKNISSVNGQRFGNGIPVTGNFLRSAAGIWVPSNIVRNDISDATVYGRSILTAVDSSDLRLLLGVGQTSTQIIYGDVAPTTNITIPTWARLSRIRYVGAGGGGGSGSSSTSLTAASGGGGGGGGGFYSDSGFFNVDALRSLWVNAATPSPLVVTLGAIGAGGVGVTGTVGGVAGNNGNSGSDSTLAVNGVVYSRARGGGSGGGGLNTGGTAADNGGFIGGVAGGNGGAGTLNSTGNPGLSSNQFDICAGGCGGSGFSTANATGNGSLGSRGGLVSRNATEAQPPIATDATPILVNGLPVPGNSGGSGASNGAGRGGNGANGGAGSGSSASRTASLNGGNGGRSWAIVEFFGSDPTAATLVRSRPSQLETISRTLTVSDALKHLYSNLGTNISLTVPSSMFATDDEIEIAANGAGNIPLIPAAGLTMNGGSATVTCLAGKAGFLKFYSPNVARFFGGV